MNSIDRVRVQVLPDGRLDRANAANYLGRSVKTLAEWARLGIGPRSFLVGGRRFYLLAELQAFVSSGDRNSVERDGTK
ncbi:DNA-binding protein [Novosphingobium sp.]|uniref:DNA-binding protein n=1 Tax=Novosphingobium sp. TaxID=1874826 RepID=UPI00261055C6|nr:DNA-binding protein [Novosphingobium sp.]